MMNDVFCVPEHVKWRRFDDEIIVLDLKRGDYLGLNEVAAAIYERLASGLTPEQAAETLANVYDVDHFELREDIVALVTDLENRGLLAVREVNSNIQGGGSKT